VVRRSKKTSRGVPAGRHEGARERKKGRERSRIRGGASPGRAARRVVVGRAGRRFTSDPFLSRKAGGGAGRPDGSGRTGGGGTGGLGTAAARRVGELRPVPSAPTEGIVLMRARVFLFRFQANRQDRAGPDAAESSVWNRKRGNARENFPPRNSVHDTSSAAFRVCGAKIGNFFHFSGASAAAVCYRKTCADSAAFGWSAPRGKPNRFALRPAPMVYWSGPGQAAGAD